MNVHEVAEGDTLTPIGMQLKQVDADGVLSPRDLAGKTVKVMILDDSGTEVVAETTAGVTVIEAATGKIAYTLPGSDTLPAGTYWIYTRVYSGTARDTHPAKKKQLKLVVYRHVAQETS